MGERIESPDGNYYWNGEEWILKSQVNDVKVSDSVVSGDIVNNTNFNSSDAEVIKAAMDGVVSSIKEIHKNNQTSKSQNLPLPIISAPNHVLIGKKGKKASKKVYVFSAIIIVVVILVPIIMYLLSANLAESETKYPSYSVERTSASVEISFEQIETDGGPVNNDVVLEIYFDDENTGEFETGDKCSNVFRHKSDQSNYTLSKKCNFNTKTLEPFSSDSHSVSITVCVYEQSTEEYFDIYSGDSEGGSCIIFRDFPLDYAYTSGYSWNCNYDQQTFSEGSNNERVIQTRGIDDGDSNPWNADFKSSISVKQSYKCIKLDS
ncbi:hypothetical protein N9U53_01545 [Euryarchaeota archaeon]|nr:hypothetical protein [Euryarchaeota archaeon]